MLIIISIIVLTSILILVIYQNLSVFNVAVFESCSADSIFDYSKSNLIFRLKPPIRAKINSVYIIADPFLFVNNNELYLFYEEKKVFSKGIIKAFKTNDLMYWQDIGVILQERFHLSFPFIFKNGDEIFMIPETGEERAVMLYDFTNFPYGCTFKRNLITGEGYFDSHILKKDDAYFLFTNATNDALKLYYSSDMMEWTIHPKNPIVTGNKISRSGGSIVNINDRLYRIAQDTSGKYGDNLSIFEINKISVSDYSEALLCENAIKKDQNWNKEGGHHFNTVFFKGQYISVFDGRMRVTYFEKLLYPAFRIVEKINRLLFNMN